MLSVLCHQECELVRNGQDDRGEVRVSQLFSFRARVAIGERERKLLGGGLGVQKRTSLGFAAARCWDESALGGRLVQLLDGQPQFHLQRVQRGVLGGVGHLADLQLDGFLAALLRSRRFLGFSQALLGANWYAASSSLAE